MHSWLNVLNRGKEFVLNNFFFFKETKEKQVRDKRRKTLVIIEKVRIKSISIFSFNLKNYQIYVYSRSRKVSSKSVFFDFFN